MAFMMPVVKQDYSIYTSGPNSRRNSACSTTSTNQGSFKSRANSLSCSPTNVITEEEGQKILMRRRSRGLSECVPDLSESPRDHQQRRRSSLGRRLSWAAFHAAIVEKLKPAEPKSKSQTSVCEQTSVCNHDR